MHWLISGSRDFPDERLARAVFKAQFQPGDTVWHGGARGVDTWAAHEASKKHLGVIEFTPQWSTLGKGAGLQRNQTMFEKWTRLKGLKRALVVWDGESHGTHHMLQLVQNGGYPLTLIQANYD